MKFPNRNNIDRWIFDYTEGNLSPEQETLLENYILNNPDLEVDLDAWQLATVSTENLIYTEKEKAFKIDGIGSIDHIFEALCRSIDETA